MIRPLVISKRIAVLVFALWFGAGVLAAPVEASGQKTAGDVATQADQIKELQQQLAELRTARTPRIVAAGTATFRRPELMDNTTVTPVKLPADIVAKLGDEYIVLLTNRYPTGGYPYFSVYWKRSKDGFGIALVDVSREAGSTVYSNRNETYLIDWIVVHDPSIPTRNARAREQADAPTKLTAGDVLLTVRVPENAIVWVNGDRSTQTGRTREFTSEGRTSGKTYTYTIHARWEEGGKVLERTQKVSVQGGQRRVIDFSNLPSPGPN